MRLLLVALAALLLAAPAQAERDLTVGVVDDGFLYHTHELLPVASELGIGAVRVNVHWRPGYDASAPSWSHCAAPPASDGACHRAEERRRDARLEGAELVRGAEEGDLDGGAHARRSPSVAGPPSSRRDGQATV
jgi:hypothetical protein